MNTHQTLRLIVLAVLATLFATVGVLASPNPADAHGELIESRPGAGAIVGGDITAFELQFVGIRHPGDHRVSVTGPDGINVETTGALIQDFQKLTLPTSALTLAGDYQVNYRIDSVDGDIFVSTFAFTYDPVAPPPAPLVRMQRPPAEPRTALNVMIVFTTVLAVLVAAWIARRLWITR